MNPRLFIAGLAFCAFAVPARAAGEVRWLDPAWPYRAAVVVVNTNSVPVPAGPLRIELPFQEGMRRRDSGMMTLGFDPHLESLRRDPRFQELLRAVGLHQPPASR